MANKVIIKISFSTFLISGLLNLYFYLKYGADYLHTGRFDNRDSAMGPYYLLTLFMVEPTIIISKTIVYTGQPLKSTAKT